MTEAEEGLRVGEASEGPGRIVIVEAGVENSDDAEAAVFWDHAEGGEFSLGAGNEDDGVDGGSEVIGHVFAEDDGRHGGDAGVDLSEVVGGIFGGGSRGR